MDVWLDGWMDGQIVTTNYIYSSMLYTKAASWNPVFLTQIMSVETDYHALSLKKIMDFITESNPRGFGFGTFNMDSSNFKDNEIFLVQYLLLFFLLLPNW